MSYRVLALLCVAHCLMDTVANFMVPLLPEFEQRFGLQNHPFATGAIALVAILASSFTQPLWGYLSDHMRKGWLLLGGPAVTCVTIGLVGLAPTYAALLVCVFFAGLGSAAFHPEGTALASRVSGDRPAVGLSVFIVCGTLGLAIGPMLAGWIAQRFGVQHSWWVIPPGLVLVAVLVWGLRGELGRLVPHAPATATQGGARWAIPTVVLLVLAIATLRAFLGFGLTIGLPFWFRHSGLDLEQTGRLVGVLLFASGLAGFGVSFLARPGHEPQWIFWTSVASLPAMWLLPHLPATGWALVPALIFVGFALNATIPMMLVLAQRAMPGREGLAGSLILGVAWGFGGGLVAPLMRSVQATLADHAVAAGLPQATGDAHALTLLGLATLPTLAFSAWLLFRARTAAPVAAPVPATLAAAAAETEL